MAKPPKLPKLGWFWRFGCAWLCQPSEGHENSNFLSINSWSTYKKVLENARFVSVVFYQHYYRLSNEVIVIVQKSLENAQFWTSLLTYWRVCWLASNFKIQSKGEKANDRSFWKGYCPILLCTYCSPHILDQLKKLFLRWVTLYILKWKKTSCWVDRQTY